MKLLRLAGLAMTIALLSLVTAATTTASDNTNLLPLTKIAITGDENKIFVTVMGKNVTKEWSIVDKKLVLRIVAKSPGRLRDTRPESNSTAIGHIKVAWNRRVNQSTNRSIEEVVTIFNVTRCTEDNWGRYVYPDNKTIKKYVNLNMTQMPMFKEDFTYVEQMNRISLV